MARTMQHYVDTYESVPVLVLACFRRYRHAGAFTDGASVYPACQNLLLAARALGYGGVMTGWQFAADAELRALLHIPDEVGDHGDHHPRAARRATTGRCAAGPWPSWSTGSAGARPPPGRSTPREPPTPRRGRRPATNRVCSVAHARGRLTMHAVDSPVFDADNHYYEALDAFTRHLDPKLGPRVIEWVDVNGRRYHALGGRVSRAVTNPTFNPITPAGALVDYFRGNPDGRPMHELMGKPEPIRPEYRDRDARLATMDAQNLSKIWLFPTLGMLYEEALKHDPGAVVLLFRAFNRWLAEDWGMAYQDRIFAAPYITLADVDEAVRELEWALDQDARAVVMRAAAPITVGGPLSPADDVFDPFWARVNEAGITVVVHAGDAGLSSNGYAPDGFSASFRAGAGPAEHQDVRH